MADPQQVLGARVRDALVAAYGADYADADPLIRPSSFGDLQSNAALPLAKKLGRPPRDIAAEIVGHLDVGDICEPPAVSGPGFINLTLRPQWIADAATALLADPRLGVPTAAEPQTVVVDYSSPNIAKEMHVGHLRTTIVGDAIVRVLELAGHHVIRDNHVGDWGTPFGMLLEHLVDVGDDSAEAGFADRARERVVKLQSGNDPATQRLWDELMELSKDYLRDTYAVLRVTLTDDDIRGESFYNDMLRSVADDLVAKGLATVSDGALCAFPAGFRNRDGSPLPLIIVKSDGGYNYATTDLATIRYRIDKLNADRALYVVGTDQAQHFKMVFEVAREAGWLPDGADFEHAQIGMVQGKDGRRLRTRAGDNVTLSELIAEGPLRARALLDEVERDDTGLDLDAIAQDVGIGAIKYADLSTARESAYIFDWDRMISFKGNTGPYLQYATTRIRSIFRRAGIDEAAAGGPIVIRAPAERELARKLLEFGSVINQVAESAEPHRLCSYLFELASLFTSFYEQCPVLKADDEETRGSRLALCAAVLRVLTVGLGQLGVPVPDRM